MVESAFERLRRQRRGNAETREIANPGATASTASGMTDEPIPDSDSGFAVYDSRARVQVPAQAHAGMDIHSHDRGDMLGMSISAQALAASWESDIAQMAQAASAMPSKGCARLIRQGVRARGYTGRDSVVIERLVWQRRREIAEKKKAAHDAALAEIEAGLKG